MFEVSCGNNWCLRIIYDRLLGHNLNNPWYGVYEVKVKGPPKLSLNTTTELRICLFNYPKSPKFYSKTLWLSGFCLVSNKYSE